MSAFFGRGKKTAWEAWMAYPEVTSVFQSMSHFPDNVEQYISALERYTVLLYDRTSSCDLVNECRKTLFAQKSRSLDNIPPTQAALLEHSKRSCFQAGLWSRCLEKNQQLPNPCDWGWQKSKDDRGYIPFWTALGEASKHCTELINCGCKVRCNKKCKCIKSSLKCTMLCKCEGHCESA